MKINYLVISLLFLILMSCSSSYEIFDTTSSDTICYINKNGKVTNYSNIKNENIKKNKYIISKKQVIPDYYIPYIENGIEIKGASYKVYGVCSGVLDNKGNEILPFIFETVIYSDGLFLVREIEEFRENDFPKLTKYGYKNNKNQWVIEPLYKNAKPFYNGLAVVQETNLLKVINKKNKTVFEGDYTEIYPWGKNLYIVKEQDHFYLVNNQKEIIVDNFYLVSFFINEKHLKDMVLVSQYEDIKKGCFGYMNKKGKIFWFNDYSKSFNK